MEKDDCKKATSKEQVFKFKRMSRFILRHLTFKKNLKMFITEYIPDVRFIVL